MTSTLPSTLTWTDNAKTFGSGGLVGCIDYNLYRCPQCPHCYPTLEWPKLSETQGFWLVYDPDGEKPAIAYNVEIDALRKAVELQWKVREVQWGTGIE